AKRQQFLRHGNHLPGSLQLVERCLHTKLDLLGNPREIFLCLRELGLPFAYPGALPATVEQVVRETNAQRSKVVRKERNIVLEAVAGKRLHVRNELVLCEADS